MVWLKETFGGYVGKQSGCASKLSRKVCFYWVTHSKAAEDLLRLCRPYFILKTEQVEVALAFRETVTRKRGRGGLTADEVAERELFREQLSAIKKSVGVLKS